MRTPCVTTTVASHSHRMATSVHNMNNFFVNGIRANFIYEPTTAPPLLHRRQSYQARAAWGVGRGAWGGALRRPRAYENKLEEGVMQRTLDPRVENLTKELTYLPCMKRGCGFNEFPSNETKDVDELVEERQGVVSLVLAWMVWGGSGRPGAAG